MDGQEWSPAQDGVQDAGHSHSAGLESLGRGRVIPSFCRALPASATFLSNFYVSIIFIFLFCRLDSRCVCLNAVKRWLACRGRGVQLLNYGGEDLSQEDLKIGTHVPFVDIMDGDVLSNTHTQIGELGPFWY